jgi:hypothetical protein
VSRIVTALLDRLKLTNAAGTLINPARDESLAAILQALPVADIFGTTIVGQLNNEIEVHFDDANWASYVNVTRSGGAPAAAQALGRVQVSSGSGANGLHVLESIDVVKYRPRAQAYGAGTVAFVAPPTLAGQKAYALYGNEVNGAGPGYDGPTFGAWLFQNSIPEHTPRSAWNIDKMDGTGPSGMVLDPTKGFIFEIRAGLFGYAGAVMYVVSPYPWAWKPVHYFPWYQEEEEPFFGNYDLTMSLKVAKGGVGANDIVMKSGCLGGGTTSQMGRISDPMSDRTLALDVRSVAWGKATNGSYVAQAFTNNGRALVSNDSVMVDGAPAGAPLSVTVIGGQDGTSVQALRTGADGTALVADDYAEDVTTEDQPGTGAVLTFALGQACKLVAVDVDPADLSDPAAYLARATVDGVDPTQTRGWRCRSGQTTYLPVPTSGTVKVWAPTGVTVSVQAGAR